MTTRSGWVGNDPDLPEFLGGYADDDGGRPPGQVSTPSDGAGHIPGEPGVWIFILGDMTVFGAILSVLMWERHTQPALVSASAAHLLPDLGFVNTLVLLVSSYLVVRAISAHRCDDLRATTGCVIGAVGCAAVFAVIKAVEYAREISAGFTPATDIFFTYYFALTALHLVHVILGSALLSWWWVMAKRGRTWQQSRRIVEGIAVYWHMVDLLWIAIFTLTYLVSAQ